MKKLKALLNLSVAVLGTVFWCCDTFAATTIDVLVVYDTTAKTWVDNNGGMATFSAEAIARMNQAMQNSGIDCTFRVVHSGTIDYTHSDLSTDLSDLHAGTGNLATAHTWRNTYGADLVVMLVDTGSAYGWVGQGYLLTSSDGQPGNAFTVNAIQSVDISHIMTHEVGHNLGCGHSKRQATQPGPGPLFSYAAGWYFTGSNSKDYHTIMTYNDDGFGNTYIGAPLFSTPLKTHEGTTAGDAADGDNSRCIRQTMAVVAGYRADASTVFTLGVGSSGAASPTIDVSPADLDGFNGVIGSANLRYAANQTVTLTAAASSGSKVLSTWSGADSQAGRVATVTMNANRAVTAIYVDAVAQPGTDLSIYARSWSDTSGTGDEDDVIEGREDVALRIIHSVISKCACCATVLHWLA
jgi:hypothetical protein